VQAKKKEAHAQKKENLITYLARKKGGMRREVVGCRCMKPGSERGKRKRLNHSRKKEKKPASPSVGEKKKKKRGQPNDQPPGLLKKNL